MRGVRSVRARKVSGGGSTRSRGIRVRVLLGALALLVSVLAPDAFAEATEDSTAPQATASSSVKKKLKKLTKRVKTLEQLGGGGGGVAGPQGPTGPRGPTGPQGPAGNTTGTAGGDLTGDYPDPEIASDAVGSPEIATNAVGNPEIGPAAVGSSEIGLGAVGGSEVLDDSLTFFDLGPDSVNASEIGVGQVGTSELNSSSVRASEVGSGIVEREGPVVTIAGGTEGNGDANVDRASASCLAGEQLVGANANWTDNINPTGGDQTPGDEELYTMEVDASTTAETASAIGANDTDNDHDFRAVAYCLIT